MSEISNNEATIIEKHTKICICKSINKATMKKVIHEGATTVNMIKYKTGAGSGACKGRRCTPRIEALLANELDSAQKI